MLRRASILSVVLLAGPAAPTQPPASPEPPVEATSLLGRALRPVVPPDSVRPLLEAQLAEARAAWEAAPADEEAIIWYGRRTAYMGRFREAIDIFTQGLAAHPDSAALLRHRGHRLISVRRLDDAMTDLARASELAASRPDEVEPDGMPNPANIPRGTLKTNIFYHLGLANYLEGQWHRSRFAYRRCLEHAGNDDMKVAASYWIYLTLRRESAESRHLSAILDPITPEMTILENGGYHALLLMFKGAKTPEQVMEGVEPGTVEDATRSYGIGAWHLVNGRTEEAQAIFRQIVEGANWPAFGFIAAEAELARK